jgi:protein-tyrosine phosphatase
MRVRKPQAFASLLLGLTLLLLSPFSSGRSNSSENGLANFAPVTEMLYRGAQPSHEGFRTLQHMGVNVVVNFRMEHDETTAEQREVENLGMKYVGIPWNGNGTPSSAQVLEFLDLVRNNPQVKIFVHCKRGADRTGTMIAAYRIAIQHESADDAIAEMNRFHYARFWLPQLQRYVSAFPTELEGNTVFAAYLPKPAVSIPVPALATVLSPK